MEKKEEIVKDKNGVEFTKTTTTTTPEDGFVPESEIRPLDRDNYGKYHYGYSKNISYTTDNPKVIASFVFPLLAVFILIGIGLCVSSFKSGSMSMIVFGLFFLGFSLYSLYAFSKEFKEIKKKYEEKHKDDDKDNNE